MTSRYKNTTTHTKIIKPITINNNYWDAQAGKRASLYQQKDILTEGGRTRNPTVNSPQLASKQLIYSSHKEYTTNHEGIEGKYQTSHRITSEQQEQRKTMPTKVGKVA
jgi:hypothetical protein